MKNKILTISIIFVLLSFIFINISFAYTINDTTFAEPSYGEPVTFIYDYDSSTGWRRLAYSTVEGSYFKIYDYSGESNDGDDCIWFRCYDADGNQISFRIAGGSNTTKWTTDNEYYVFGLLKTAYDAGDFEVLGTLYNEDGTVFFLETPSIIAQELIRANPTETYRILMKSVVISLLMLVIGLLAFSKAWAWLKTLLSKA